MTEISFLEEQIKMIADMGDELKSHTVGCYERFVLKYGHGLVGTGALPVGVSRGEMGRCFSNAAILALLRPDEFVYTEGYAMVLDIMPTLHAWCTDRAGNVVDPTWTKPTTYYGVLI